MKLKFFLVVLIAAFGLYACAELTQIAQQTMSQQLPLSQAEIVAGLKDALRVGTDSSVARLSKIDGYLRDEAVKILLPPEAKTITDNLSKLPGGAKLVDDVIVRINRAAEDAARQAAPIFGQSIREMSFADAVSILKGPDNAATLYFKEKTSAQLAALYQPKIKESLNKDLVGHVSTQESWDELCNSWNKVANSAVGKISGFKPVDVQLDEYLTRRALDGLFLKIEGQEKAIRTDASARVTAILKRVFGNQ
jgi:hypothetical protein